MSNGEDNSTLGELGSILIAARDEIIRRWGERLQAEISSVRNLRYPVIIDTLPAFLDNLAEALTPSYPRAFASEMTTVAQEHGGIRARLTSYSVGQLIREYHILRDAIFEVLAEKVSLSAEQQRIIVHSIDEAICESVTAFALVQTDIREQFIATLAHDLRNPLSAAVMVAELIQAELGEEEEVADLAQQLLINLKRIEKMTSDIMDVTIMRAEGRLKLELHETEMLKIVQEAVSNLVLCHGKRIKVLGSPVKGVWAPDAVKRAIENMADNALKYSTPDSPITISVASISEHVQVEIHNEGPPIPKDEQETIFQVYCRAEGAKAGKNKGWGMGLALVRGVAESHGGSIRVDSAAKRGTTFTMDLPLDARPYQEEPGT